MSGHIRHVVWYRFRATFGRLWAGYLSLVLLDTGHTTSIGGVQADWLGKTLKARAEHPNVLVVKVDPQEVTVERVSPPESAQSHNPQD